MTSVESGVDVSCFLKNMTLYLVSEKSHRMKSTNRTYTLRPATGYHVLTGEWKERKFLYFCTGLHTC